MVWWLFRMEGGVDDRFDGLDLGIGDLGAYPDRVDLKRVIERMKGCLGMRILLEHN